MRAGMLFRCYWDAKFRLRGACRVREKQAPCTRPCEVSPSQPTRRVRRLTLSRLGGTKRPASAPSAFSKPGRFAGKGTATRRGHTQDRRRRRRPPLPTPLGAAAAIGHDPVPVVAELCSPWLNR